MTEINPTDWQNSTPQTGTKCGKTCLVYDKNRRPIETTLPGPLRAPFGASNFDDPDAIRQNLDLTLDDDDLVKQFQKIDEFLINHAIENRETLFKGNQTPEKIRESYRSLLRTREGYKPMLRTKVNLEKCRCWNETHEIRELPQDRFRQAELWVKIAVRQLWYVSATWGLTLECTDVKIREQKIECPFYLDF